MYIMKSNGNGFMTDNIDELRQLLQYDPKMVKQLNLDPTDQMIIAKENIMAALMMPNPILEVGLLVMERYWTREAYNLVSLNMDDHTYQAFRTEIHKRKLMMGTFHDETDKDKAIWSKIKDYIFS